MPDRDLSKHIRRQLSAALDGGAPLIAPLPSQARFAALPGAMPSPRWRLRALTVVVAAAGIVVVALAGPSQPREWVVQSVNGISKQMGIPAGSATPSPATSGQKKPNAATESPEATAEPGGSPEPAESQQSPVSVPSGGSGGGDQTPEPSPTSGG